MSRSPHLRVPLKSNPTTSCFCGPSIGSDNGKRVKSGENGEKRTR